MTISIIVPIYNTEPYLRRCLDSLLEQRLNEGSYEVLLINDGSTDNSLDICEQYRNQHPNIFRVISKRNEGVSATRNLGIEQAKGDWIYFMDSDDYLVPGGLATVIDRYLDESIDMLTFCSVTLTDSEHRDRLSRSQTAYDSTSSRIIYEGDDCLREFSLNTAVKNTVFKHSILLSGGKASHVRFESVYIAEDFLFKLECAQCHCRERRVNDCIYHYIVRNSSAITTRNKAKMRESISCFMKVFQRLSLLADEWKNDTKMMNTLMNMQTDFAHPFFSRVLSADLSTGEFSEVMRNMQPHMKLIKECKIKKIMILLKRLPTMYRFTSLMYRHVFMTIVYPLLRRN